MSKESLHIYNVFIEIDQKKEEAKTILQDASHYTQLSQTLWCNLMCKKDSKALAFILASADKQFMKWVIDGKEGRLYMIKSQSKQHSELICQHCSDLFSERDLRLIKLDSSDDSKDAGFFSQRTPSSIENGSAHSPDTGCQLS